MVVPYASQAKDRGRFVLTIYTAEPVELLPRYARARGGIAHLDALL